MSDTTVAPDDTSSLSRAENYAITPKIGIARDSTSTSIELHQGYLLLRMEELERRVKDLEEIEVSDSYHLFNEVIEILSENMNMGEITVVHIATNPPSVYVVYPDEPDLFGEEKVVGRLASALGIYSTEVHKLSSSSYQKMIGRLNVRDELITDMKLSELE